MLPYLVEKARKKKENCMIFFPFLPFFGVFVACLVVQKDGEKERNLFALWRPCTSPMYFGASFFYWHY